MSFRQRLHEIRTGFERAFWVANFTELFERLSYYGASAVLAIYLSEELHFSKELTGWMLGTFGFVVWFLPILGGALADRFGFRRALMFAYLVMTVGYFLLGSLSSPWMGSARQALGDKWMVFIILMIPALGPAVVKPCVAGTTARASQENVRSIGYSIYYTIVNIGGTLGPVMAWLVRRQLGLGTANVFRVSALSVFLMFWVTLLFFREPTRSGEAQVPSVGAALNNMFVILGNFLVLLVVIFPFLYFVVILAFPYFVVILKEFLVSLVVFIIIAFTYFVLSGQLRTFLSRTRFRFVLFLLIFSSFYIVFWQEFISAPLFLRGYVDPNAPADLLLSIDAGAVILFQILVTYLTKKIPAFPAMTLGLVISSLSWLILAMVPTTMGLIVTLVVLALGEMTQSARYYDYISRLAPPGQQGLYMGCAFVPIAIGYFIAGPLGGYLLHYFGDVLHRPQQMWWVVTGIGLVGAVLMLIYDKVFKPGERKSEQEMA